MYLVKRTCTEASENDRIDRVQVDSLPLSAHQQIPAYVLLGDPGAGKTTLFEQEAERQDACYITARDLITFEDRSEWRENILFIDGLDEIRAGTQDTRTPFDAIRAKLNKLGPPGFRLSCREADWFGASDRERLKSVSPDGQVKVLHLDPLKEADILEILQHEPRVPDAKEFIDKAQQRGLEEVLKNPQILEMLVQATADGSWPGTRKQTFEMACQTVVREHNQDHIEATRTHAVDEQLDAAGFLCAVQLIAGNAGYALSPAMANDDFPELNQLAFNEAGLLDEVARTKLFRTPVDGRVVPVHRHVAEYLAARYLAGQIDRAALPATRILALITGEDGIVVSELRGLSAWLAALSRSQRSIVIDRDPLGVVLYGDVDDFTQQEKRRVLDALQREAERSPRFRSSNWAASPFGALATKDMETEFRSILTKPDRSESHQALVDCVLDAVYHGTEFPSLDDTLLDIVRDATWWPGVRRQALEIIQHRGEGNLHIDVQLKLLLEEISGGTVPDSDDDLLGLLLFHLYPATITVSEVLDYLHMPKRQSYLGRYWKFWRQHVLDSSSDSNVIALLDELAARQDVLQPALDDLHFRDLGAELLARGLEVYGESVKPARLYGWLGVGLDRHGWHRSQSKAHNDSIRSWLGARPAIQKAIIRIALDRCALDDHFDICMRKSRARLYAAEPPADFGRWCLDQLPIAAGDDVARYLLQEAVDALCFQRGNAGLSLDVIRKFSEQNAEYRSWLNDMLVCPVNPELQEDNRKHQLYKAEEQEKKQAWLRFARSQLTELHEGRAYHSLLHDLAMAYFGRFIDSEGDTPTERLRNFLDHDDDMVQAAFEGLRSAPRRQDIPDVEDIIQLHTEDRGYYLKYPILAGLDELTRLSPDGVFELNDRQIRQAVAFYLTNGAGEDPNWYQTLRARRPELVAKVMTAYVGAALRARKQHISGLYALAYVDGYDEVARLASLTMLKAFPARSAKQQLNSLDKLLIAALRYADRKSLLALIEEKLYLRSMDIAQRVRWLAAGLIVAPDKYLEPITAFTDGNEIRVRHLADFLADRHDQWSAIDNLPIAVSGLLVRLIGGFFAPYELDGLSSISPAMNAADFVSHLINRLGSQPGKEATDILDTLSANPELSRWQSALQHAQFEQRAVRRESSFSHPDIRQVSETLNNRSPANAGDLAALTVDVLRELAHWIRNGNTDDYLQYWNKGRDGQADFPKHEEECRNALLSDLQQRLAPLGIDAQPEGRYADSKRADIRVAFGGAEGFQVPIEIKKNSHANLWRAIHQQLIARYTRDPLAHGFGIYLVFWFGPDMTQPPASGPIPHTASKLEARLRSTLTSDENWKISICVIDVSTPG